MTEEEAISDLATEFRNWLRVAEIGAALVYFSGNLAAARQQHQKIAEGANTVWREGYLAGLVRLTKRKIILGLGKAALPLKKSRLIEEPDPGLCPRTVHRAKGKSVSLQTLRHPGRRRASAIDEGQDFPFARCTVRGQR